MPALIGIRRWEGMSSSVVPPGPGSMCEPMERWVILALGIVVRVALLPPGTLPVCGLGETARLSLLLQLNDKP